MKMDFIPSVPYMVLFYFASFEFAHTIVFLFRVFIYQKKNKFFFPSGVVEGEKSDLNLLHINRLSGNTVSCLFHLFHPQYCSIFHSNTFYGIQRVNVNVVVSSQMTLKFQKKTNVTLANRYANKTSSFSLLDSIHFFISR